MSRLTPEQAGGPNVCAFLDMLAWSEIGAPLLAISDDGYNVLVGSTASKPLLFNSYATHPNVYNKRYNSTAAGRYQLLGRYWPAYRDLLKLLDFGPESQDRIAIQMIREQHAFDDVVTGHLADAIGNVSNIWASLPGNSYHQHQQALAGLTAAYIAAGGTLA